MSKLDDLRALRAHLRASRTLIRGVTRGLPDLEVAPDPIALFERWFSDAVASGLLLPESTCLATTTPDGNPSARMVLLKGVSEDGFRFFTNYGSRKAGELDANPRAALCFHWSVLERQVRVEGSVLRLAEGASDIYFSTRARASRIGAWASRQSQPIDSRAQLRDQVADTEGRFDGADVPRPEFWGGYVLAPERIEFWQGRANRLHDRLVYAREAPEEGGERPSWTVTRLQP